MPNQEPRPGSTYFRLRAPGSSRFRGVLSLLFLFGLTATASHAATSAQSGPWSQAATWGGAVPTSGDVAIIAAGHMVTVDIATATASTTTINGTLSFSRVVHSSLTVVGGNVIVNAGGSLDLGTAASPIPSGVNAHLVLAHGNSPGAFALVVQDGGDFSIHGATKTTVTNATVDLNPTSGLSFTVADATGWAAGDILTIGPTSRLSTLNGTEISTVTSVAGNTVTVAAAFTESHHATATIRVGNLTRNALIRSSGTITSANTAYVSNLAANATSFVIVNAEFAFIGSNVTGRSSVQFDDVSSRGSVSSSTFHHGHDGIALFGPEDVIVSNSLFAFNAGLGVNLADAYRNRFVDNDVAASFGRSIRILGGAGNRFVGNHVYGSVFGINEADTSHNTYIGNRTFSNLTQGFTLNYGNFLLDDSNAIAIGNHSYNNGIGLQSSGYVSAALIENYFYDNGVAWNMVDSIRTTCYRCGFGYTAANEFRPNDNGIDMNSSILFNAVELKESRVQPGVFIATAGLDAADRRVVSYNQDYATGTLKFWGDYTISQATWTLDYADHLYRSTATSPNLVSGSGHSARVCSANDSSAVSQLIAIERAAGAWRVVGSSSGLLGAITPGGSCPGTSFGQFSLILTEGGSPRDGDALHFALLSASADQNRQKRLLFGRTANSLNEGRSKLQVAASGGLVLKGISGLHALVEMQAGGTYYTIVSSGAFTAQYSSFTNADSGGLQLSGNRGVSLSNVTFDFMGFTRATSAYVTARSLTSTLSIPGALFGVSRSTVGQASAYNVRVEGAGSLAWTFQTAGGPLAGEPSDDDPSNSVQWTGASDSFAISCIDLSSVTASMAVTGATSYALIASTASNLTGTIFLSSTSDVSATQMSVTGLALNTTYFLRFDGLGPSVAFSSSPVVVTLATGAAPVGFSSIAPTQFRAAWSQNSNPPGTRFEVSLSTIIDHSVIWSSSTETALFKDYTSLIANSTYFFRVRAVNWAGTPSAYAVGAVVTRSGVITVSANRLPGVWYNTSLITVNAQGAGSYLFSFTVNPNDVPPGPDSFDGSALSVATPQGTYYFHVLGVGGAGDGEIYHFGPVFTDLSAPAMASIAAQKSASDATPIADGATTVSATPLFTWPAAATVSPVAGYSFSVSTNASDTPPLTVTVPAGIHSSGFTFAAAGRHYAKIRALNLAGNWSSPVGMTIDFATVPSASQLVMKRNHFSPTRGECAGLDVLMPQAGRLRVELFTLLGERVSTWNDRDMPAGVHSMTWCGRNADNRLVATGAYVLHIESPDQNKYFHVVVVK